MSHFLYDCKINNQNYTCELDTTVPKMFLSLKVAKQLNLPIQPTKATVILGDDTSAVTAGAAKATIRVENEYSEEDIHLLEGNDMGIYISKHWETPGVSNSNRA